MGGQPELKFPLTALYRHLKVYGKFGLIMAIFTLPSACVTNEESDKHNRKVEDNYRVKINAAIRDAIRFGYI
jgi:hypothetical protein